MRGLTPDAVRARLRPAVMDDRPTRHPHHVPESFKSRTYTICDLPAGGDPRARLEQGRSCPERDPEGGISRLCQGRRSGLEQLKDEGVRERESGSDLGRISRVGEEPLDRTASELQGSQLSLFALQGVLSRFVFTRPYPTLFPAVCTKTYCVNQMYSHQAYVQSASSCEAEEPGSQNDGDQNCTQHYLLAGHALRCESHLLLLGECLHTSQHMLFAASTSRLTSRKAWMSVSRA